MREPSRALLYSLLGAMVLLWAANFIVGKMVLREFPALLAGGLRTAIAGALMVPIYAWRSRGREFRLSRAALGELVLVALLGVALNQLFFIVGLSRTSVAHAAILIGLTPILVLAIAAAMRMERLTIFKAAGMLVALAGVGVLNAAPAKAAGVTLAGDAFILLGATAFAVFTVAGKKIASRHGPITVSAFAYAGGALMLAPLTIWYAAGFSFARVSLAGWVSLFYMAAFPSVVCYLIYYWALTHIPATRVAAFSYLQPLLATAMAVPLLGEPVTPSLAGGGALVLAGVFISERISA